ncbi:MAG: prepilin-type N-terminal cleavage/methylation domain-containing protein [Pseudomonadota bacterium]
MLALSKQRGFTLLEIIVVVVIVSVIVSFATLSVGGISTNDRVERTARKIQRAVELGAEEAFLVGHPIGMLISHDAYEYQIYKQGRWENHSRGQLIAPATFKSGIVVEVLEQDLGAQNDTQPNMVFLPDGERLLQTVLLSDVDSDAELTLSPYAGQLLFD